MLKREQVPVIFVFLSLLVVAGSCFFLFVEEPEVDVATSLDGVVTVTGLARKSQSFTIDAGVGAGGSVLVGPVYRVEPADITLESPALITFNFEDPANAESQTIYFFDETFEMWEAVERIIAHDDQRVVAEVDHLGSFSLGLVRDVSSANFLADRDQLISMAPENTVGFEIAVGIYADSQTIKLDDGTFIGGCGGVVEHGNRTEQSQVERMTRVYINDVETPVTLLFTANWFVNESGGCDILPLSIL